MGPSTIESLLKAANSSPTGDASVTSARRSFSDEAYAGDFFESVRTRLFQIGEWRRSSSVTDYALFDENGRQIADSPIAVGNFIRINLYGSGKYDWVRATDITDEAGEVILTVKPSYDPTDPAIDRDKTSHFFGPEASNNFCVQLDGSTVTFYVIGLNEKVNSEFVDGLIEAARNTAVANVGYYSGLQKAVWKQFCSKMLHVDEEVED